MADLRLSVNSQVLDLWICGYGIYFYIMKMNNIKLVLALICLSFTSNSSAQNDDLKKNKVFVGLQSLGPAWLGSVSTGCVFNNRFHIEIGGGLVGYYGGFKYAFHNDKKPKHRDLYIGALFASALNERAGGDQGILAGEMDYRIYMPIGLKKQTNNFYRAPEIAINWFFTGRDRANSDFSIFLGYQVGWLF